MTPPVSDAMHIDLRDGGRREGDASGTDAEDTGAGPTVQPPRRSIFRARVVHNPLAGEPVRGSGDPSEPSGAVAAPVDGRPSRRSRLRIMWIERGDGYRVWVGGPVPPGAAAWTLGSLVIVRRRHAGNVALLAHEAEHVRQWSQRGRLGFIAWYLAGYFTWRLRGHNHSAAYRRIPAEVQADWRSRRRLGRGCGPSPSTSPTVGPVGGPAGSGSADRPG